MADNYLITGYWGEPHVTAENDRGINAAIFGAGRFVLPVGNQFRAEYIGNNTIRLFDGKLIDNGAVAGIPAGQYVDLLVPETGQGLKRNDLIVFQYEKNATTLVESGVFTVVNGVETAGTATDPELTQEDILSDTATFDQMALWRVSVEGSVISAPVPVFKKAKSTKNAGGVPIVAATSTDGINYEATVENVDELYTGMELIIIPSMTSKSAAVMLDVNGLGACRVRMPISSSTSATTTPTYDDFYAKDKPVKLIYDKSSLNGIWRIADKNRANAVDLYGTTPITKGGTGADNAQEARVNLGIETANGTVTSGNADFAEVGEWSDGNPESQNRIGYFVCLDTHIPGVNIRMVTSDDDIRGVTVTAPAFSGNCSADKFDENGALLPQYDYVACIGIVSVIDDGTCYVGGRCMPNENSTASAVTGEYGYLVMERIDDNHVLIALEPGTDYQYKANDLITGAKETFGRAEETIERAEAAIARADNAAESLIHNATAAKDNLDETIERLEQVADDVQSSIDDAMNDMFGRIEQEAAGFNIVQSTGDSITRVMSQKATTEALDQRANALKGTASGEIIALDDVSPLEHKVGVKLRSKNLFDVSKIQTTETITNNGDGSLTLSQYANFTNLRLKDLTPSLKVGDIAVLSVSYDSEPSYKAILLKEPNIGWTFGNAMTITEDMLNSSVYLYGNRDNVTVVTLSNIQIELGTTATAYTPFVADNKGVIIKTCGKNLFDGVLTEATAGPIYRRLEMYFAAGVYTISFSNIVYWQAANVQYSGNTHAKTFTFTIPNSGIYYIQFRMDESATTPWDESTLIQVECGTTATPYEPYNDVMQTTMGLAESAELPSVSPNMTILTDTTGVVIEANYNKDINIVIEKMTQAIISLGGNI